MQVEYIQENNNYGLRFSDLFNQFAMIENSNLKNLYKNMGYTDEEVANIPDSISINENLFNIEVVCFIIFTYFNKYFWIIKLLFNYVD